MDKFDLNQTCPFERKSTKHYSSAGNAPDLNEAKKANKLINEVVGDFVKELEKTDKSYSEVDIGEYDRFAKIGHSFYEHVPGSLSEIFPIPESRNAQSILFELESYNSEFANELLRLHKDACSKSGSNLKASREVMRILRNNFERIFTNNFKESLSRLKGLSIEDGKRSSAFESDPDVSNGIKVTSEIKDILIKYQNIQERFEDADEIKRTNEVILANPGIMRIILGIQKEICGVLEKEIEKNPELNHSSIAFGEIALFGSDNVDLFKSNAPLFVESSRLLKIILHNWGRYFTDDLFLSAPEMIKYAIGKALEDEIYFQYISIFTTENSELIFKGITPKLCPARTLVGRMINHYL